VHWVVPLCLEEQSPWKMEIFLLCNPQQTITLQLLQRYSSFPSPGSVLVMTEFIFAKQTWCKENGELDNNKKKEGLDRCICRELKKIRMV